MYSSTSIAALTLLLSSTASAYTLQNVTLSATDKSIQYYPPCVLQTFDACEHGAWYRTEDPRFLNGTAMACSDPDPSFGSVEPYLAYTFRGSAMYMYQWMNSSTAQQVQLFDSNRRPLVDLTQEFPQFATSGNLTPVMTWALEGLDPLKEHTIGVQHLAREGVPKTRLIFDYMVVTMTTLEPGDLPGKKKLSSGAIAGAVVAAVVGCGALVAGFFLLRRYCNKRVASKSGKGGRLAWEGSFVKPATLKFADPSSEIEASERMAREGRIEEEQEGKAGPLAV